MPESQPQLHSKTAVLRYTTYVIGRLDKVATGLSLIEVQCSSGESCQIKVETATDKVLDVQGDVDPFNYWMDNVRDGK